MIVLQMWHGELANFDAESFQAAVEALSESFRPVLKTLRESQTEILGVAYTGEDAGGKQTRRRGGVIHGGELFLDDRGLMFAVLAQQSAQSRFQLEFGLDVEQGIRPIESSLPVDVSLHVIGANTSTESDTDPIIAVLNQKLGINLQRRYYENGEFDKLKSEAVSEEWAYSAVHVEAAKCLADDSARSLALKVKSSGGLLLSDIARHVQGADGTDIASMRDSLTSAGIVESEVVVVCRATSSQVARVTSVDVLPELSDKGLKCACGKPIHEEPAQDLLTVTNLGRLLLEKSRWMTVLVREELLRLGVREDDILVEAYVEGHEVDCLTLLSGESLLLELKDNQFSMGHAYSLGAKISIAQPGHWGVVTTGIVDDDVKQHFAKVMSLERDRVGYGATRPGEEREPLYVEGLSGLRTALEDLASEIYRGDCIRVLGEILPMASVKPAALLRVVESRRSS